MNNGHLIDCAERQAISAHQYVENMSLSAQDQKCYTHILPDELLSAIFDIGAQSADNELSFPMVVSAVSLRWRHVAISTLSLWTSILVDFSNARRTSFGCNFLLFFERSKVQPLYITIRFFHLPFTSCVYKDLSEAISKNTGRIREIVISIDYLSDLHWHDFVSPFNSLPFPILSRLEIDSHGRQCFSKHAPLFTGAMHIRSMVFPKCPICAPLGPDLTHLEIRKLTCDVDQLRAVFQASPSLHTLTIYKFGVRIWEDNDSSITASSLHTLNLTIHNDQFPHGTCVSLLPHLVTPNLINLTVKLSYGEFNFAQQFSTLPKIEKLTIVGFVLTPEDGLVIQQWSSLIHVELIETDHTCLWSNPQVIGSPDPWRNLTAVTLDDPSSFGRVQMVEAIRRSCTQSPRTITLNINTWYPSHIEELRSELPNAVLNRITIKREFASLFHYDTSGDDDDWSDGSDDYYGDIPDIDDIDYELDVELDPYSHYYDDDDSFDEEYEQ
ncbi:hypothetical protein C0989_005327 [Termitomyces sp. Mn162]|nr:hypothetical protein C0989_005327 [Termitomyces sp. Mn162]